MPPFSCEKQAETDNRGASPSKQGGCAHKLARDKPLNPYTNAIKCGRAEALPLTLCAGRNPHKRQPSAAGSLHKGQSMSNYIARDITNSFGDQKPAPASLLCNMTIPAQDNIYRF